MDFAEIERAHDDLLADEAAESIEERLAALTLRDECIRCGDRIEQGLARLGSTECVNCKQPHNAVAA